MRCVYAELVVVSITAPEILNQRLVGRTRGSSIKAVVGRAAQQSQPLSDEKRPSERANDLFWCKADIRSPANIG
jgi:ribose 1,5-bisphosphokinase PhnN